MVGSRLIVPVAIRRAVADTDVVRRVVIRGFQQGVRLRKPRVDDRVLVNSFPKAGTHLVARALDLSQLVRYSWQHFAPRELPNESEGDRRRSAAGVARSLHRIPRGHYATAHLAYDASLALALADAQIAAICVVRDPRALLISNVRYVMARRRHFLHRRFSELYRNDEERIRAFLEGFPSSERWGLGRAPFDDLLAAYVPWLRMSKVHVRFEDLAGPRAGGTRQAQLEALTALYSVVRAGDSNEMASRIADEVWSQDSVTFHSGQIDSWRTVFPRPLLADVELRLGRVAGLLGYDFAANG